MLERLTIRQWIADKAGVPRSETDDDAPIFTSGLLDSFDLIELVTFVEQQTGKRVRPLDINMRNFDSVSQLAVFGDKLSAS